MFSNPNPEQLSFDFLLNTSSAGVYAILCFFNNMRKADNRLISHFVYLCDFVSVFAYQLCLFIIFNQFASRERVLSNSSFAQRQLLIK